MPYETTESYDESNFRVEELDSEEGWQYNTNTETKERILCQIGATT